MADDGFDVRVAGAEELAALARRMKTAGAGDLRKEMKKELRAQAQPIVDDLKRTIAALPVKGVRGGGSGQRRAYRSGRGKNHGLRRTVASAVQFKITDSGRTTGARIRIDRRKLPEDQKKLPKALNRASGWRHPVFGHRDRWAQQTGREFWLPTIEPHAAAVTAGMKDVLRRFAEDLDSRT